jgi:hypothetical protein
MLSKIIFNTKIEVIKPKENTQNKTLILVFMANESIRGVID